MFTEIDFQSKTPEYEIVCIKKDEPNDPYSSIIKIGYKKPSETILGGSDPICISLQETIRMIESKEAKFFVAQDGRRVNVTVGTSSRGHKYIKTENDGEKENNLLSLPECKC